MDAKAVTEMPYGPSKWAALGLTVAGTLIASIGGRGWLVGAFGYAIFICMLCTVPMGRVLGPHVRPVQLIGGLVIIGVAIALLRSSVPEAPFQGTIIAFLGVTILIQGIFPALRTWQPFKGGTRPSPPLSAGEEPVK